MLYQAKQLRAKIEEIVDAVADPSNAVIKPEMLASIAKKKSEVDDLENEVRRLRNESESGEEDFLRFAYDFIENMATKWVEISEPNPKRCKQIMFPAGILWTAENKVYTPEVSPLIRLAANKKVSAAAAETFLVRQLDYRWNRLCLSLYLVQEKLVQIGLTQTSYGIDYIQARAGITF